MFAFQIERAFKVMILNVINYRKHCDNADGLKYWYIVKDDLAMCDMVDMTFQPLSAEQYALFMDRKEHDENGNVIEKNHFMMQLARLPTKAGNLRKLMQLALNLGQYRQIVQDDCALPDISIHTFVSNDELTRCAELLDIGILTDMESKLRAEHERLNIPFHVPM